MDRRRFVGLGAALASSALAGYGLGRARSSAAVQHAGPPGPPLLPVRYGAPPEDVAARIALPASPYWRGPIRVACNAYSFNALMREQLRKGVAASRDPSVPEMDVMKLLDWCADPAHRFDALDVAAYYFPPPGNFWSDTDSPCAAPPEAFLRDFRQKADDLGLAICATGIHNDFGEPDPARRAIAVENFKKWCDVANKIGTRTIRIFSGLVPKGYESRWDEAARWMIGDLRRVSEIARENGVRACVQNHGDMLATSEQIVRVLRSVDNPDGIGASDDTGYFMDRSPDGSFDWYGAIARILPYSIHMQFKSCVVPVRDHAPTPDERTDVKKLVAIIRSGPFRGYLPIETLQEKGRPYNPFAVVPEFLELVRRAIDETASGPG